LAVDKEITFAEQNFRALVARDEVIEVDASARATVHAADGSQTDIIHALCFVVDIDEVGVFHAIHPEDELPIARLCPTGCLPVNLD
jgi:hypothetical protein